MRLIFVTQVLDRRDAVLGFVSRWVEGLAAAAESVRVLALEVGDTEGLPANVDWIELGRTGTVSRYLRYRRAVTRSFSDGFDGLLTHMVPRYSVLAGGWARRAGVPHYLWYTHKGVDRRLLKAVAVVDGVFTASAESMRVDTPKKIVTGHGIDAAHFDLGSGDLGSGDLGGGPPRAGAFRVLSVGRVTPAKDPLTVVEAVDRLRGSGIEVTLRWAGGALARGDDEYGAMVRTEIDKRGLGEAVEFVGEVPYPDVPQLYSECDLFVNASRTGSVDKVVLEAMAARRPFVSCNESIAPLVEGCFERPEERADYAFAQGDVEGLTRAMAAWAEAAPEMRAARSEVLAQMVRRDHDVDSLMSRLVRRMEGGRA